MSHSNSDNDGTVIRPGTAAELPLLSHNEAAKTGGASPSDNAEYSLSLRIGTRMAEFEITDRIGEGGFSIVYLAMDHSLERTVALKEYMPSSLAARVGATQVQPRSSRYRETFEAGLKSFVNEAKLLAQFDHPALVKVYRFWEANGTAYMVMPFYQGMTLKDATRALPAPPDEAWLMTVLAPLTEALMVIHAEHCYHRDIAPDNVLLLAGSGRPLLLDFGAARRVIGDMTQALTVILKPGYAPVEQYAEVPGMKQGPWTDVYALAAVVYWAITGKTPPAAVGRVMSDSFVPLAKCAAGRYTLPFLQTIDRALVVLPEQRTPSIEAFRLDLGLSAKGQGSAHSPMKGNNPGSTVIRLPPSNSTASTGGASIRDVYPFSSTDPEIEPSAIGGMNALALPATPTPQMTAKDGLLVQASSQVLEAPARHGSKPSEAAIVGDPKSRRVPMILSGAAVAVVLAAAGIWLALQTPEQQHASGTVDASRTPALADQPSAKQGPTVATGAHLPAPSTSLPLQPSTQPDAKLTESAATEVSRTAAQGPTPASEQAAGKSSARTSHPAAPTVEGRGQTEQKALRTPPRTESARPERRQADSATSDECASITHRLSLGESSPELVARLRTLNCR
jgi:serine/threonine protein kinase